MPAAAPAATAAWSPDVAAARAYLAQRPGLVSFSVIGPGGRAWGHLPDRVVRSASVVKTMLMLAYLRRDGVRTRPLGPAQRGLLDPMIRRSDNDAADRVYAIVRPAGLRRLARSAGMRAFAARPVYWGGSRTTARDQAVLMRRAEALLPPRHRAYAMGLLRDVVPSQRWGIARVAPPGWTVYAKPGWGSGPGAVTHQAALLQRGERRVAVAIMTTDNPSHKEGERTLRGVAARLLRTLR